ncbi:phage protease [Phaeobacter inhibens]|uniref:phage protease n=1 Tax=Phaeobacter inhibens TaxID=221822 RepID=UPI00041047EB|nr:phage protease [Phaeobacter inhibens]
MTQANSITTIALALNAEGDSVPDWIQLTPPGPHLTGRDGRQWRLTNPDAVVAEFARNRADLPVDFEHATQVKGAKGDAAPAVGWIKELEARNGAIWGRVEWNDAGRNSIASKGYRYVSPVFTFTKAAKEISKMISAGLTNQPNLELAALNTEDRQGGADEVLPMNKAILEALGLPENASDLDVVTAINKMKTDEATARNRAENPDSGKFIPRADYDLAMNKLSAFETAEKERQDEAINTAVGAAIEAGKIAPSSRDYHVAACRSEGGLEKFQQLVDASPVIAADSELRDKTPTAQNKALSPDELAICRQMGLTPEEFHAAQAETEES